MIDQDRPSPPPSWYDPGPEYVDCCECGKPVEGDPGASGDTLCRECIDDIRADQAYDAMIDGQFE
jgi:hypothetical protein